MKTSIICKINVFNINMNIYIKINKNGADWK